MLVRDTYIYFTLALSTSSDLLCAIFLSCVLLARGIILPILFWTPPSTPKLQFTNLSTRILVLGLLQKPNHLPQNWSQYLTNLYAILQCHLYGIHLIKLSSTCLHWNMTLRAMQWFDALFIFPHLLVSTVWSQIFSSGLLYTVNSSYSFPSPHL